MDTWEGKGCTPITLNKYLYANANPVMYTDPSGYMSLGESSAALQIMGVLAASAIAVSYSPGQELSNHGSSTDVGYTPIQIGWLTVAWMSGKGTQVYKNIKEKLEKKDQKPVKLARVVEDAELAQMYLCGCYSLGPNAFPKQFFHTDDEAVKFGSDFIFRFEPRFHLTNAFISEEMYNTLDHNAYEPGIGPIVTVPNYMLPAFNLDMDKMGGWKFIQTFNR